MSSTTNNITPQEVKKVVMSCKNGKDPGPGAMPTELIKATLTILFQLFSKLLTLCISGQQIPAHFKEAIISNIKKNGVRTECTSY